MRSERVTLITLGVADLARSRGFYQAWGWRTHPASMPELVLFQLNGCALSLFAREALAADQGRAGQALGTGALTLAQNFPSEADVDACYALGLRAGATALKPPQKVFWGGYSSYLSDPDGHVWELAHNPFWPLAADGTLTLPE